MPNLPAPLNYLNVLILVGMPEVPIFNHVEYLKGPHAIVDKPSDLTTLMSSTAADGHHFFQPYKTADCELPDAGSRMRWGSQFTLETDFSSRRVVVRAAFDNWSYDLEVELGDHAVWFVAMPFYDHLSLPFRGQLRIGGQSLDVSGCLEYARGRLPPVPAKLRPSMDALIAQTNFFAYHVVSLDAQTQLLWGDVHQGGKSRKFAHIRSLAKGHETESFGKEVSVEIQAYDDLLAEDGFGRVTRLPRQFCCRIVSAGNLVLEIECVINTPWREGLGLGYVGGYAFTGKLRGHPKTGSALVEWVDLSLQQTPRKASLL